MLVSGPRCSGLGAVCCLFSSPPTSRLAVRSCLFFASRLAVGCSLVVATPPPLCVSRFSSLPLGALFFFLFRCAPPVVSGFLWCPAAGALSLGAVCCLFCSPPASRLSVRCPSVGCFAVPCCRAALRAVLWCPAVVVGCWALCGVFWGVCLCRVLRCWLLLRVVLCLRSCGPMGLFAVWLAVWFWSALPCAVLCCVSLGAMLRRAAARCAAWCCAVVCCVVLLRPFGAAACCAVPSGAARCPGALCSPALCFKLFSRAVCSVLCVFWRGVLVRAVVRRCAVFCVCPFDCISGEPVYLSGMLTWRESEFPKHADYVKEFRTCVIIFKVNTSDLQMGYPVNAQFVEGLSNDAVRRQYIVEVRSKWRSGRPFGFDTLVETIAEAYMAAGYQLEEVQNLSRTATDTMGSAVSRPLSMMVPPTSTSTTFPSSPMPTPHVNPMPTPAAAPMASTVPEPMNLDTIAKL